MITQFKRRTVGLLATAVLPAALLLGFGGTSANAAQQTVPKTDAALAVKSAYWPELHKGDCQQDNGHLVIRSNGTGYWSATTLTYHTHTHDVWHSSFDFYTTAGFHLFRVGTFDSPGMSDGNPPPRYSWTRYFTFDPAEFRSVNIFKTIQHSSC